MVALSTLQSIYTVVKQIYDVIQKIKDAPEAIQELKRQALVTQGTIEALKADLEGREDADVNHWSTEPRLEMLERARELAEEAEKFVKKATKETEDGETKVRKILWVLYKESDAKDLAAKFQAFNVSLGAIHGSIQVQLSRNILDVNQHGHWKTQEAIHTLESRQEMSFRTISQQTVESTAALQHTMSEMQQQLNWMMYMAARQTLTSAADAQTREVNQAFDEISTTSPTTRSSAHQHDSEGSSTDNIHNADGAHVHCERHTCPSDCKCRCHKASKSVIPFALSSILGRLYVPHAQGILSMLSQPRKQCDEPTCKRHHTNLLRIKYYFPSWFQQINAEIRIENQSSVHFSLRIPRVVDEKDLYWLIVATPAQVREKLWSRELTVNDVSSDGYTVLHLATGRAMHDHSDMALSVVALLTEYSAPLEWEYNGLTATEFAVWRSLMNWQDYESREAAINALKFRLGPYLSLDIEDTWEELAIKLGWTYSQRRICALSSQPSVTPVSPEPASQVNAQDALACTSLLYASLRDAEAMHALLRTRANPRQNEILTYAARAGTDSVISALVRAGADVNATSTDGRAALHWAANYNMAYSSNEFAVALGLVRHAGHMLDWDLQDSYHRTALDSAKERVRVNPTDEDSKRILELYSIHQLPDGAQYLPAPSSVDAVDESIANDGMDLPPNSLIRAALKGDLGAIGDLIHRGGMVNERNHDGRTLLHLVALGQIPDGYRIALELVRNGGWGVHWDATMADDDCALTPLEIAEGRLAKEELNDEQREDLEMIRELLRVRRLPPGEKYLWPCMDPDFYEPSMPGAWDGN